MTPTPEADVDCLGVAGGLAELDCCGVCAGDGTSCPELCKEINNVPAKKRIRREAKRIIDSTLRRIARELQCSRKSGKARLRKTELLAQKKQLTVLLSIIEDSTKLCDTPFCKKTSLAELTFDIRDTLRKIVSIDKLSQRAALKACGQSGKGVAKQREKFNKVISELPTERCD